MDDVLEKFIVVPLIAVIGIFVVGTVIQVLFNVPQAASLLFSAVGGIYFVSKFYQS
jgi:ABC-type enterochelin transport system permease subunit